MGSAGAKSDFVTQITPGVSIVEKGARTSLTGTVSVPMLLYARTGSDNNTVYPTVGLFGKVEAVERLFFIEGAVNVSQQYLTPFASRPSSLATVTSNRYTAAAYRISPYFKGVTPGDINYELRDTSTWTRAYQTQSSTSQSYSNEALASVSKNPAPWGWSAEYNRSSVKFPDQAALVTQLEPCATHPADRPTGADFRRRRLRKQSLCFCRFSRCDLSASAADGGRRSERW